MMTKKQIRMLELLDEMILKCEKCSLFENGRAKPYWTKNSRYAIIGEAPGADEVKEGTPFIGKAGNILWDALGEYKLSRSDFLIINSANCRPKVGNKNGKPTKIQMERCKPWIVKYLKVIKPEKILILGNYALETMLNEGNILERNGELTRLDEFNCYVYKSVHPAYCIYNKENGVDMLRKSIKIFREDIGI
jgi:uracil-DNA glycosylase